MKKTGIKSMNIVKKDLEIMVNAINRIKGNTGFIKIDADNRIWQDDEIILSKGTKKETYLYLSGLYDGLRQG